MDSSAQPIQKRLHLNPYDYHKYLINEYVLKKPGDTKRLHERDRGKPTKTIRDVVMENMQFIWNDDDKPATWEERLAKKYYDKLFREYCICDLSKYKENKIANRFRIEKEIVSGKGQFVCAETSCKEELGLRTWEVNFAYVEAGERKNALVKIRLCPQCSEKINYHSKKREVKRIKKQDRRKSKSKSRSTSRIDLTESADVSPQKTIELPPEDETNEDPHLRHPKPEPRREVEQISDESLWKKTTNEVDTKNRDDEFDDYLADLLL